MNKKLYILVVLLALTSTVFGQFVGRDNFSISMYYMQKAELDSAKKYIDLAAIDETLNTAAKTWYYRGYIYKELYKKKEKDNRTSPLRLVSIESFKEMLTLEGTEEWVVSTNKILNYLASTLNNDAARLLDPQNYSTSITNYDKYRSTMLLIDPTVDLTARDIKFKLALASVLNRPARTAEGLDSAETHKVKSLYLDVLALDPNHPGANYNLGILFYNEAADIINGMDYDMDIMKLNDVQDHCIEIFLQGLPYMKKSYEFGYKRRETLIGLKNIYYGLNDIEKSEAYKKELEDLDKE